uniref:Uncharacterized protein n=1 Tax=Oryza sativa subsp. japonica TaxID=39947 RepID=Q67VW3_ORYSJ|nr:hypothetical protein [Oryza sativa Japonica Group]
MGPSRLSTGRPRGRLRLAVSLTVAVWSFRHDAVVCSVVQAVFRALGSSGWPALGTRPFWTCSISLVSLLRTRGWDASSRVKRLEADLIVIGIVSPTASSTSARLRHRHRLHRPTTRIDELITRSSARLRRHLAADRLRLRVYAIKLWVAAASPLSGHSADARGPPPLVVGTLRGALLSMASLLVEFSPLHRHRAASVSPLRVTVLPISSSSSPFELQHTGRWSSYLYMATNVAVQAVGPATSPSTSSSMTHRQRRRIFLDYTSLFSSNCVLLRQFSLYAVLAP